ncbi:acetyltransferase [Peribacillus simplex]|uniref:acetyltransferase n=1 Tax=Peribacillus simplex TaxID=1478 RepID=UPI00366B04F5
MNDYSMKWLNRRKTKSKFFIVGAGNLGQMTASILLDIGDYQIQNIAFIDDVHAVGENILGISVIGSIEETLSSLSAYDNYSLVVAIGNNKARKEIIEKYSNLLYSNVVHPSAVISKFAQIGIGNIILPNVSIDPNAMISNHVIINKNSAIGHNVVLSNYSQVCPGCNLGGNIGEGVFLGLGTIVIPNKSIGEFSIIGAGSLVINDIPANCTAVGAPCRPIKFNSNYL